jgi:uncharacterized BrkB/YihY/UPF0761 family membrane protein
MVAASSLTMWFVRMIWLNVSIFFDAYQSYLVVYIVASAIISFAFCYYRGPPTEPRFFDLVQWAFQAGALALIYCGLQV